MPSGPLMQDGDATPSPSQWQDFLARYPDQGSVPAGPLLALNAVTHEELYRTNAFWNAKLRYVEEIGDGWHMFSRDDIGTARKIKGDCEDYALSKRAELRGKFPEHRASFRIAEVMPTGRALARLGENGVGYLRRYREAAHAVLTVDTTGGTVILDLWGAAPLGASLPYAMADQPEYRWIDREATADHWVKIRNSA
jgi:predicted transglutaminase-like cysteine proteinase